MLQSLVNLCFCSTLRIQNLFRGHNLFVIYLTVSYDCPFLMLTPMMVKFLQSSKKCHLSGRICFRAYFWLPSTVSFLFLFLSCPETISPCQRFGRICRVKSKLSKLPAFKWSQTSLGGQCQGSVVAEHFPYLEVVPDGLQCSEPPALGYWAAPR